MSKATKENYRSESPEDTAKYGALLGALWAKKLKKLPRVILLEGVVGAGKTVWVRGFISGYFGKDNIVCSPSYSLINQYCSGKKEVIHADFYRLQSEDDLESLGFWDLLSQNRVIIVEWGNFLKPENWPKGLIVDTVNFEILNETTRFLKFASGDLFGK